ncbi:dihydroxyacetone kinase family protein [Bacteroides neonati]|uniref:dihydroxyacetone kinase family protein n=1 Tax=Bacteroides neonati TaxID=1347393 RepID=UPI0004B5463C|nr:DAK2 domain-containing protein [Bacteroides neonati]
MEKLTTDYFQRMIESAAKNITERADEFSQLDAVLGDGDHGEAISTAFQVIAKSATGSKDFKTLLGDMGFGVMLETSGSTSTLLGGFLLGMSDCVPAATEIDAQQVKAMFRGGLEGVVKNTKAKRGDKTMMDALIPAIEAMEATDSNDVKELFNVAAQAALQGVEDTIPMKANFGRARNLGDKTIGHPDAGATSWACMFQSFASEL